MTALEELLADLDDATLSQVDALLHVTDPLEKLFDNTWTPTLWEYEHSRTESHIPGSLHPKQEQALTAPARHRWLFWGNQVGKTTLGAVDVVLTALGRHPVDHIIGPTTQWASALTWELWEKILLPELLTWIPYDRIVDAPEPYRQSTKRDILVKADNGTISRITGKAAEQGAEKYQSARIHKVWLDEEHPKAVWDEMQPRLLRHGGRTIATMTPLKGLTWVYRDVYEPWKRGQLLPQDHYVSHAGLEDNPSLTPEAIDALVKQFANNPSQLAARTKGLIVRPSGLAINYDAEKHLDDVTQAQITDWVVRGRAICGMDFGSWRFAFLMSVEDETGKLRVVEEVFSQREGADARAKAVQAKLAKYGAPPETIIAGDCANPQDIMEFNLAMERMKSPYRCAGVQMEHKSRTGGVDRINALLKRGALSLRRGIGAGQNWMLGMNVASDGAPVEGSRVLWEIDNWRYPKPDTSKEDKPQVQDPNDKTADGADMMAALRYMVLTWSAQGPLQPPLPEDWQHRDAGLDYEGKRIKDWQRDYGHRRDQRAGAFTIPTNIIPTRFRVSGD